MYDPRNVSSFDLETTGVDPFEAKIVTASIIEIEGNTANALQWVADPGVEIPQGAADVHGYTTERARAEGSDHEGVLRAVISQIYEDWSKGKTLIVYNAAYDLSVLAALDPSFEVQGLVIDPFVLDRGLDKYRKGKRTLTAASKVYGVSLDNAHASDADAVAAALVGEKMSKKWPWLVEKPDDELMRIQKDLHEQWALHFIDYLNSQGKDSSDVSTQWPMRRKQA